MLTVYWLQGGGCGGDTFSFLSAESPDVYALFHVLDAELLWHPSLSNGCQQSQDELHARILAGEQPVDVLIVEGAVLLGPNGTGMFDARHGKPKKDLIHELAHASRYVIALGTCAAFGGVNARDTVESVGLQFDQYKKGGFLGVDFTGTSGVPVINLAGCPCHHDVIIGTIMAIGNGQELKLDDLQRPLEWFNTTVHQGCTRNEYHEYRVEESAFGEFGCLFYHLGCHGPLVSGPCNKLLWNQQSSKPRSGVPCFGCTDPWFPGKEPFFRTPNIEGVPLRLPMGINRAHYLVYKTMAAAAAPDRLKKRSQKV
jgi:NiFe hydrogenase small subunit HydA